MADKPLKTQIQLETEGWKQATLTSGSDLNRILEMYRELGVEVYIEEVKAGQCEGCTQCFTENNETIYRIYTRQLQS